VLKTPLSVKTLTPHKTGSMNKLKLKSKVAGRYIIPLICSKILRGSRLSDANNTRQPILLLQEDSVLLSTLPRFVLHLSMTYSYEILKSMRDFTAEKIVSSFAISNAATFIGYNMHYRQQSAI
jgi:hypothetical protein